MNKDIAMIWAKALRSGKYKQGLGQLKYLKSGESSEDVEVKHCCLGVLCEVAMEEGLPVVEMESHRDGYRSLRTFDNCLACLPWTVMRWAGIMNERGCYDHKSNHYLDQLNDSGMHDFESIANVIERNWEVL